MQSSRAKPPDLLSARPLLPSNPPDPANDSQSSDFTSHSTTETHDRGYDEDYIEEGPRSQHIPIPSQQSNKPPPEYVRWGIEWKTPAYMIALILCGSALALGHHFYFASLDGTEVGSSTRQQWATQFGTAFSFLIMSVLKMAIDVVYSQYIWNLFRRKAYSFETLDKLFSLTRDPTGFFSLRLLKNAKVAVLIALACWCITLGGITPPATLSVVPGLQNSTRETWLPSFDWALGQSFVRLNGNEIPTSKLLDIATQTAEQSQIIPLTPPAANSSFALQFYGPTVQCSYANSSQKAVFDYYSAQLANQTTQAEDEETKLVMIVTAETFEAGNLTWNITGEYQGPLSTNNPQMLVLSAFAPLEGSGGWLTALDRNVVVDQFNNWDVQLPGDFRTNNLVFPSVAMGLEDDVYQQLWVQTSNDSFVCIMGNASYNAGFEFVNGAQNKVHYSTSEFEPLIVPITGLTGNNPYATTSAGSYMGYFVAFTSLLSGNVTISLSNLVDPPGNMSFVDTSSKVLLTGLSGCEDFMHNYWEDNPIGAGPNGPILASDPEYSAYQESLQVTQPKIIVNNTLFQNPVGTCRNRTLINAVEDLAVNITMSMLSSANLTSPNTTLVNVTYFETRNKYQYDSRNLIVSYSISIFVTLISLLFGFYALFENGVVHSTSFSAIVATTRNPELVEVSRGNSLGAEPMGKKMAGVKLRFGELIDVGSGDDKFISSKEGEKRIGFGLDKNVLGLRRGESYI